MPDNKNTGTVDIVCRVIAKAIEEDGFALAIVVSGLTEDEAIVVAKLSEPVIRPLVLQAIRDRMTDDTYVENTVPLPTEH